VHRWLCYWLATQPHIRPATRASYESHVRLHLGPTLGRSRLDELTPPMVQAAFTRIAATRTRTGQRLSAATVRRVHATLRAALNAALRDGLLATNPAWHTRLPLAQPNHPEVWTPGRVAIWQTTGEHPTVAVWTPEQLAAFLDHRRHGRDPLYPAWRLIALRGLRRGEACGLRWADLDLDPDDEQATGQLAGGHGRLRVVQAIVQIGGRVTPAPPKTPASRRTISLDPATTALLRDLRADAARQGGGLLDPTAPVLVDQAGRPIQPQRLTVAFRRAVAASGLPPVRLHDLRHGAASLALAAGADLKTVQDLLGHSTIITTADIYTSVLPEVHDRYADAVADLVAAAQQRRPHPQH
jgi:integrase